MTWGYLRCHGRSSVMVIVFISRWHCGVPSSVCQESCETWMFWECSALFRSRSFWCPSVIVTVWRQLLVQVSLFSHSCRYDEADATSEHTRHDKVPSKVGSYGEGHGGSFTPAAAKYGSWMVFFSRKSFSTMTSMNLIRRAKCAPCVQTRLRSSFFKR